MAIIHKSPYEDVEILDVPVTEFVLRHADALEDKPAFIEGASGRVVTFGELKNLIHRFAGGLASRGFGPGDTLALVSPNLPEYAVVFHGTAVAGGTVTTVNPTYGAEEIRFQLNDATNNNQGSFIVESKSSVNTFNFKTPSVNFKKPLRILQTVLVLYKNTTFLDRNRVVIYDI